MSEYEAPLVVDYGSIVEHTFQTPGNSTKDTRTCELDTFEENSCPSG